jgi:hypothetical protein
LSTSTFYKALWPESTPTMIHESLKSVIGEVSVHLPAHFISTITDFIFQLNITLGPLLFLLYINDLPYLINKISKPILYADDISILCHNSDPVKHVMALKMILD